MAKHSCIQRLLLSIVASVAMATLILVTGLYLFLQHQFYAQLKSLVHGVQSLLTDRKDLTQHIQSVGAGEISTLIDTFNKVLQILDNTRIKITASAMRLEPMSQEFSDSKMSLMQKKPTPI